MAKMVGLSRNLKLSWLNEVARLYVEGLDENEIKDIKILNLNRIR